MARLEERIHSLGLAAPQPPWRAARHVAGGLLAGASLVLGRLAQRLAAAEPTAPPRRDDEPAEFYAEAGAPEGALYIGGELVGWVRGVARL